MIMEQPDTSMTEARLKRVLLQASRSGFESLDNSDFDFLFDHVMGHSMWRHSEDIAEALNDNPF